MDPEKEGREVQDEGLQAEPLETPAEPEGSEEPDLEAFHEEEDDGGEEREPGGNSPQEIRARKEYRRRKKLEQELSAINERLAVAEALARERQQNVQPTSQPVQQQKIYTSEEVWQMVRDGQVTEAQAIDYIAEVKIAQRVEEQERKRTAQESQTKVLSSVQQELNEYIALEPTLKSQTHPRFPEIREEYAKLKGQGFEDGIRTELVAVKAVLGPIGRLKNRKAGNMNGRSNDNYVAGSGWNASRGGEGRRSDEFSDIPKHFKEYWDHTRTPLDVRKKEAEIYREREKKRKSA